MSGESNFDSIPAREPEKRPAWIWYTVIAGYFLPCLIGIVVWLLLQWAGKPVMSIGWIVSVVPILCIFSAIWVLPFLFVALVAGHVDLRNRRMRGMIYGALVGTVLAEVVLFGDAWTNAEAIFIAFLALPVAVFAGTMVFGGIGFLCGGLLKDRSA